MEKFFHKKIHYGNLRANIKRYGLSGIELAALTGFHRDVIYDTLNNKDNTRNSLPCLFAIIQVLEREKARIDFCDRLLRKPDKHDFQAKQAGYTHRRHNHEH